MENIKQKINLLKELDIAVESRFSAVRLTSPISPVTIENYSRDLDFAISRELIASLLEKVISIHTRNEAKVSIYLTNSTDNRRVTMKIKTRADRSEIGVGEIKEIKELAKSCLLDNCKTTKNENLTTILTFKRNKINDEEK